MAIFHLRHASIGRSTHAAGTAGAHAAYITRSGACREIIGEHIPLPRAGERGGEARTWLDQQEATDRKNARVIDKVTIALPRELDAVQRIELVRDFAAAVTEGRAPWLAAIHDQGKDSENPHAHVVLRDRDLETGKRVWGRSGTGLTDELRETWERVCNAALERAGHTAQIDRRSLEAQGIDREPGKHEGPIPRTIEADGRQSWKLDAIRTEAAEASRATQEPQRQPERPQEASRGSEARAEALSLLRGEIEAHRRDPVGYEPPGPDMNLPDIAQGEGPWPTIHAVTRDAQHVLNAGRAIGADMDDDQKGYQAARDFFPDVLDRMHLTAVLAKCADFVTRVEAYVKNHLAALMGREPPVPDHRELWPVNAADAVERIERDLGLERPETLIAEARDLAGRERLTLDQQGRLIDLVEKAIGPDQLRELRSGNADAMSRVVPNPKERFELAEKFLQAEAAYLSDRTDALAAVQLTRNIHELDGKIRLDQERTLREAEQPKRSLSRDLER